VVKGEKIANETRIKRVVQKKQVLVGGNKLTSQEVELVIPWGASERVEAEGRGGCARPRRIGGKRGG